MPNDFIFTLRSLNRIGALLFLFITLEKYLAVATTRSHFNLYETQFCPSTKGVISFKLMARKKIPQEGLYAFLPDNTWKCRVQLSQLILEIEVPRDIPINYNHTRCRCARFFPLPMNGTIFSLLVNAIVGKKTVGFYFRFQTIFRKYF